MERWCFLLPQETPSYLDNLLNPNNGSSSKKFRREIRAYNSMFAFTSMGAVVDNFVNSRPGSYVFKVNGYCHHVMGSLLPMDNKGPKFAQLYIFDTDNEVSNRLQPFCNENFQSSLDSDIVVGLINMLDSSNQLVRLFRHARQRLGDVEVPELKLRLIGKRDDDSRQYDDPSLNDIGGLVVGDIGHCRSDRDIIIEKERLDFIRANQENLRSEHYKGIHDAIARGDTDGSTTGKIILPSSLTGSPRYMVNNYQDAMAICRCYGNPDLFITFTCNVNWPEIRREIKKTKGYQPEDKPDINSKGNQSLSSVLGRPGINKTMLTEWFERNRVDVDARDLFYSQFPNKLESCIFSECYLIMLKEQRASKTCGKSLVQYFQLFKLACKALGLLGDDKEWSDAFGEAIPTASSPQLRSLRDVLRLNNPFGGKSVLLGGDFRQILPVIPGGTKEEIINASFTSSLLWSAFTFLTLNQNMRLSAEGLSPDQKDELRQFAEWILLIGDGQICDLAVSDDHDAAFIKIPCELQVEVIDSPIAAIVSAIYPDIERAHLDPFYFKDRAIVTPKNLTVSEINNFILDIIPGHKYNFLSCDSIQTTSGDIDNIDLL
ncbi:uncharacterized protein [Populus alba]|uniref:uncharacterized protein n=1 Tax=Populus alba TaxID=43335 RepID=UPI003CC761DC